jgi:hypothetical protein
VNSTCCEQRTPERSFGDPAVRTAVGARRFPRPKLALLCAYFAVGGAHQLQRHRVVEINAASPAAPITSSAAATMLSVSRPW